MQLNKESEETKILYQYQKPYEYEAKGRTLRKDKGRQCACWEANAENMEEVLKNNAGAVTMVMLPQTAFEELKAEILGLKGMMQAKAVEEANAMWIESEEARKMLGVSPRTWQSMRDRRELPFSQYGRKIYVRRADIEAFLESHVVSKDRGASHE